MTCRTVASPVRRVRSVPLSRSDPKAGLERKPRRQTTGSRSVWSEGSTGTAHRLTDAGGPNCRRQRCRGRMTGLIGRPVRMRRPYPSIAIRRSLCSKRSSLPLQERNVPTHKKPTKLCVASKFARARSPLESCGYSEQSRRCLPVKSALSIAFDHVYASCAIRPFEKLRLRPTWSP